MFEVDPDGLRQILADEPPERLVYELIGNAWDERVERVSVNIERIGLHTVAVCVLDDAPEGWKNLADAYTLFAPSYKKANPNQRGRWNIGEKLVAAAAKYMCIETTTGMVVFQDGKRSMHRRALASGSAITCHFTWTRAEEEQVVQAMHRLLVPSTIEFLVNGMALPQREQVGSENAALPTMLADTDGMLRRTIRKAAVQVFPLLQGQDGLPPETAGWLYEMGIPVVETGDPFHINITQKVPLNKDRDNVPASFIRLVRGHALNIMSLHNKLTEEAAKETWATEALESGVAVNAAVDDVVKKRFGEKAVIADPSDTEATKQAVAEGYTVVHGGSFTSRAWSAVRTSGKLAPAGKVFPTPMAVSSIDGKPPEPTAKWTAEMEQFEIYAKRMAEAVLDRKIEVSFYRLGRQAGYAGAYRPGRLTVNLGLFGRSIRDLDIEAWDRLLLHEFGHETVGDHLSRDFADECIRLAVKLGRAGWWEGQNT